MRNILRISGLILLILIVFFIHSCKKDSDIAITDSDGNVYSSIKIGTQEWLTENLKTTKYRNGDLIGTTSPSTKDITSENTPKYQWAYNGDESNVAVYGSLYTWYVATDSRKICPAGWHVPNNAEWLTLTNYLGGTFTAGGKLKESGTAHWQSPNVGATNESGFTALPGGSRIYEGIGTLGFWWSATESDAAKGCDIELDYDYPTLFNFVDTKKAGFSVRCIKDN
jgi:uncharacterized protein (TIGR02145 family)